MLIGDDTATVRIDGDGPPAGAAGYRRAAVLLALVGGGIVAARLAGVGDVFNLHEAERLRAAFLAYGVLAPALFVAAYVIGGLVFVPGFVLTLLAGVVFGPWLGACYASIASTLAACVAFLIARYAGRALVEAWAARRPALRRLDAAVARNGGRVVIVTRLVPMAPFGVLNYAYGITGIGFGTYAVTSWAGMLPATAALTFTAGAVADGHWDSAGTLAWIVVAAGILVGLAIARRALASRTPA